MTSSLQISKSLRQWVEATTHRTMRDQARYVKSLGFSMPQFFMLMRVYYKKQCGISDLSEHMEITAAAASQTVDKLVQSGLLDRAEDPSDRRAKQVTLSPKGRELIEKSIAELSIPLASKAIVDGTFTGGIHVGTLGTGEVRLAPFHHLEALISDDVKADLERIAADIIAGRIQTVP